MMDMENDDKQFDAFLDKNLNAPVPPETEHRLQNRFVAFQESITASRQKKKPIRVFPPQWRYAVPSFLILAIIVWTVFSFGPSGTDTRPAVQMAPPLYTVCIDAGNEMKCDTAADSPAECLASAIKECLFSKELLLADKGTAGLEAVEVDVNYGGNDKGNPVAGRQDSSCVELNVSMRFDHKLSASEERNILQHVSDNCLLCEEYQDVYCVSYTILGTA
jgi:hypothetical protein